MAFVNSPNAYLASARHLFPKPAEVAANARLIAAAPDLLAAVRGLLYARTGDVLLDPALPAFQRGAAALRKATGI